MNSGHINPVQLLKKIGALAGSSNFSVLVLVMSITYVLILAVFGLLVEAPWLDIMSVLLPFKLLYALFFLNLILVGIRRVPAAIRWCQASELPRTAEELSRFSHATAVRGAGFRVREFTHYLKRRGYRVQLGESESKVAGERPPAMLFYASSGRFSALGNLLFHASFLMLLVGAVLNGYYRFDGRATLGEGESFRGGKAEYWLVAGAAAAKLPKVDFDVEKIEADFWKEIPLFTRLETTLLYREGRAIAKCSSAVQVGDAAVTIDGYGYFPTYELKDRTGKTVDQAQVKLNLISPAREDSFQVRGYPHKIFVKFYPDHAQVGGKIVNKSMNPVNPAYFLRIFRGRIPVYTGFVKPGEWAQYDGLSLSFPSYVKSGEFRIVRNPGHPLIWIAFIMMGAGLAWKLLFYRKELVLWQDEAGRTWLAGRFDYYPKLHAHWLAGVAEEFKGESA